MVTLNTKRWTVGVALAALAVGSTGVQAQEIVQPLPAAGSEQLSSALQRIARNAGDVDALVDAGDAALQLKDIPAAIGFFGRAKDISPGNPRVSLGLARAYTYSRRPVEALRLYADAERGGMPPAQMAADRALAFDLVGDATSAQQLYRVAIAHGANEEVTRHLALSQAISGDKAGFEATLLPQLQRGESAGFRTRAFGLAILGEIDEAVKIAEQMMPAQTAARVAPYLRYMTQLTPAQQAAAGSLGVFPRTASIGRDDADIAAYSNSNNRPARVAGAELPPVGAPISPPAIIRSNPPAVAQPAPARTQSPAVAITHQTSGVPQTSAQTSPQQAANVQRPVATPLPAPPSVPVFTTPPVVVAAAQPEPSPVVQPLQPAVANPEPLQTVADAFAGFDLATATTAPRAGAVDITSIKVPREVAKPAPPPPPPAHPARHWVQVATGKDLSALGFDWRRIARKAEGALDGKGPFTTRWGEANRLLAGPYPTRDAARDMVNKLKQGGLDAFPFSSEEGEEIAPLK